MTAAVKLAAADADIQSARNISAVEATMLAAERAGEVAHQLDCVALAHKLRFGEAQVTSIALALEADLLDTVLLQRPASWRDGAILALVARHRIEVVIDNCDEGARPIAEAIRDALMAVAGLLVDPTTPFPASVQETALEAHALVTA